MKVVIIANTRDISTTLHKQQTHRISYTISCPTNAREKNGGLCGQFLCSTAYDVNLESRSLLLWYLSHGYPLQVLEEALLKASQFKQDELLDERPEGNRHI